MSDSFVSDWLKKQAEEAGRRYQSVNPIAVSIPENNSIQQEEQRQLKWDRRYMELAKHIASWSRDPSTKVGAVIVKDNIVVGMGYNGFPRGVVDYEFRYNDRPTKLKFVVHAEVNAVLNANQSVRGGTIYIWPPLGNPQSSCNECAKVIIQAGIERVVGYKDISGREPSNTWKESCDIAREMFVEAGIEMDSIFP